MPEELDSEQVKLKRYARVVSIFSILWVLSLLGMCITSCLYGKLHSAPSYMIPRVNDIVPYSLLYWLAYTVTLIPSLILFTGLLILRKGLKEFHNGQLFGPHVVKSLRWLGWSLIAKELAAPLVSFIVSWLIEIKLPVEDGTHYVFIPLDPDSLQMYLIGFLLIILARIYTIASIATEENKSFI